MNKLEENVKTYYQNNKENFKIYYQNNKENIKTYYQNNKEKKKEYNKEYKIENKEKIKEKRKKYYLNNSIAIKEKNKKYSQTNKIEIYKYIKNRKELDPLFKLKGNIRSLISIAIKKQGYSKKSKTFSILCCTEVEFKKHLERQFTKGMTWDNLGQWHLDHIYPVSLAKDEQELIRLNHYTNFQPMWAVQNIIKGNKIIPNTQIKLI
jgi:hypothetical protein